MLKGMLIKYGEQWYWDPNFKDPLEGRRCDLMMATRDQVHIML